MELSDNLLPIVAYVAALVACFWLARKAPDKVQLIFLTVIGCAMVVYIAADLAVLFGARRMWEIRAIGTSFMFFGVLVYLMRQLWLSTEICKSLKSERQ